MNSDGLSVISGGRYDSLAAAIGHKSTVPGIGWAAGVDRIANAMEESWQPNKDVHIGVVYLTPELGIEALKLCNTLAQNDLHNLKIHIRSDGSTVKDQLKYINKQSVNYCIFLGPDELSTQTVRLKDFSTSEQETVPIESLIDIIKGNI